MRTCPSLSLHRAFRLAARAQKLIEAGRHLPYVRVEQLLGKVYINFHDLTQSEAELMMKIGETYGFAIEHESCVAGVPEQRVTWIVEASPEEWAQAGAYAKSADLIAS